MPALDPATRDRWRGLVVVDRDGVTIGTVTSFYLDRVSGVPTWALVLTGWFTDRTAFVPIRDAAECDGEIKVTWTRAEVRRAPRVETFGGSPPPPSAPSPCTTGCTGWRARTPSPLPPRATESRRPRPADLKTAPQVPIFPRWTAFSRYSSASGRFRH